MVEPKVIQNIKKYKMMKLIRNIAILLFVGIGLVSCSLEDPIESTVTFYPVVELQGDNLMLVEKGTTFDDPGISATIQGEDVDYETSGSVDTSTPGKYQLTYSAFNEDGFAATVNRNVYVYENNGTVAGFWEGSSGNGTGFPVLISSTSDANTFEITDILVGHYEYGRNYGPAYAAPSTITVSGNAVSSPGGANGFGFWSVDAPSITDDQRNMSWGATLVGQGFSLSGLKLEKVTP